jgi:antitoxin ParD1/3/4
MARAKTFSLGDTYDGMIADLVKSGRFSTETEVVRAGIRMLADYEARMAALREGETERLRQLWDEAEVEFEQGQSTAITTLQEEERLFEGIRQRGIARSNGPNSK